MSRMLAFSVVFTLLPAVFTSAQNPAGPQRRQLQQQVVERLLENGRAQAGLTDDQFARYSEVARRHIASRNEILRDERLLWEALEREMRPGVAADPGRVTAIIDSLAIFPQLLIDAKRMEMAAYAEFLEPVQRAQLMLLHRRFENNIRQILQRRRQNRPG